MNEEEGLDVCAWLGWRLRALVWNLDQISLILKTSGGEAYAG